MHPVVLTCSYTCDYVLNDVHLNPRKECVTNQQVAVSVPGTMHVVIHEQARKCRTSNRNKMHIEKVRTK